MRALQSIYVSVHGTESVEALNVKYAVLAASESAYTQCCNMSVHLQELLPFVRYAALCSEGHKECINPI